MKRNCLQKSLCKAFNIDYFIYSIISIISQQQGQLVLFIVIDDAFGRVDVYMDAIDFLSML